MQGSKAEPFVVQPESIQGQQEPEQMLFLFSPWQVCSVLSQQMALGNDTTHHVKKNWDFLKAQLAKNPPAMQETLVQFLSWEDPLEKGQATHCSILAWRITWTLQPMESLKESDTTE